jgi:acyl phosphate:glycerol-3-phosphate acyltransferase
MRPMESWVGLLWAVGGYLVGTVPSTYLVARARAGTRIIAEARRDASEADAHMLVTRYLGWGWSALAATLDVAKGLVYALAAQRLGHVPVTWLALAGVAIVVGHGWPPYARAMAGRGLSAASGVLVALLPIQMVVAGVIIVLGIAFRVTGPASTLAFASVPAVAAVQGQPAALVAMSGAILAVILLRRLEGVGAMVRRGTPPQLAVYYRTVWDVSGPRRPRRGQGAAASR